MHKHVLLLCNDNSTLSIIAQAVLGKYLAGLKTYSAGIKKNKPIHQAIKKALIKDTSWDDNFHSKSFEAVSNESFDLVIILSNATVKQTPVFDENTIIIQIEYEKPNLDNSTDLERLIKTIKMELIPITRDVLEL